MVSLKVFDIVFGRRVVCSCSLVENRYWFVKFLFVSRNERVSLTYFYWMKLQKERINKKTHYQTRTIYRIPTSHSIRLIHILTDHQSCLQFFLIPQRYKHKKHLHIILKIPNQYYYNKCLPSVHSPYLPTNRCPPK